MKKEEHVKCLQEYPFTKYALGSQDLNLFFATGLIYSMEKYGDISFMNFLESRSLDKEAIFFESVIDFLFEEEYGLLLRRLAVFSECFKTFFIASSDLKLGSKWKLSPEALYYISVNCNISVFHVTKLCCLKAFVSK